jgi:murein tripeptide amidase MpaA
MAYLAANDFNPVLGYLVGRFPTICSLITGLEPSIEGRTIQGIRIGKPGTGGKRTVLMIGGCHARELVNPDLLLAFASELMYAYDKKIDLVFGTVVYGSWTVQMIVQAIDIIIVPLINPDGRAFAQSTLPMWRKNRLKPDPGQTCFGVDINRNFDFLWSSGIGTSTNPCSDTFKGKAAFSEPESRNVRRLLDNYPEIEALVDVHSYAELVLYPWGDDETQTTDPTMNFLNPAFNGQRGIAGDLYREYMSPEDKDFFEDVGYRVRDAIYAVRGHCYTAKPSFGLYPTSGTSTDYAYSRHIVDSLKREIIAYALETGTEFQPLPAEASQVMTEVCAGLFEFCVAMCCPILSRILSGRRKPFCSVTIGPLNLFNEVLLMETERGRRYESLLTTHFMELRELMQRNKRLNAVIARLLRYTDQIARLHFADPPGVIDARLIQNLDRALIGLSTARGIGAEIKEAVDSIRRDLPHFENKTFAEGLKSADREKGPHQES